ncbi:hypothetical protein SBP28_001701 [Candidozyma auris]
MIRSQRLLCRPLRFVMLIHSMRRLSVTSRVARIAPAAPSISSVSLLADQLVPKCSSCGIRLQTTDKTKEGYYVEPSPKPPKENPLDSVFESHVNKMSEEDRKLLLNGSDVPDLKSEVRQQKESKKKDGKIQCLRCRDANLKATFDLSQFPIDPVSDVMETIPPGAPLVYVVSGSDFPMSVNEEVFKYRSPKHMKFVVTKTDLLFSKKDMVNKYGERFYQDYFERSYGVPRENVFAISGTSDWNSSSLLAAIEDGSYIIGTVNSGKSTLIQSLLHAAQREKSELPNARRERQIQKLSDELISKGIKPPSRMSLIRSNIKKISTFKQQHGPGVSYMPGFTRGNLPFELTTQKTVFDVPGFSSARNTRLSNIIKPEQIKKLLKGKKVYKVGMYDSHYETVKAGQVLTVGGLFFLQVPDNAMLQIRNCINHKSHVFKNLQKALDVFNGQRTDAMKDVFLVDPDKADLQKYIVPLFHGKKDIVLQFLGHIVVTPTGAKNAQDPFVIYLPKGVEAILRQPITNYITTTLSGRDANGNPLRKENWKSKSTKEVKRWTGKIPFYTDLVPASEYSDHLDHMQSYVQRYQADNANENKEPNDKESEYAMWFQKK